MTWAGWALAGAAWLAAVNLWAWLVFRHDKIAAGRGGRRVSEATLLALAFVGGWFGARDAQRRFRHKTRKEPFRTQLAAVPFLWAILLGLVALRHFGFLNF